MAHSRRNQEHLGIDTNVLVAYLDRDHPSHRRTSWLADEAIALNPTIIHESYHTLVFKMKWAKKEAFRSLLVALTDERNLFLNQTLRTIKASLHLAVEYGLGGRDALIIGNLLVGGVTKFITFDRGLIILGKVRYGKGFLAIRAPHK